MKLTKLIYNNAARQIPNAKMTTYGDKINQLWKQNVATDKENEQNEISQFKQHIFDEMNNLQSRDVTKNREVIIYPKLEMRNECSIVKKTVNELKPLEKSLKVKFKYDYVHTGYELYGSDRCCVKIKSTAKD